MPSELFVCIAVSCVCLVLFMYWSPAQGFLRITLYMLVFLFNNPAALWCLLLYR